MKILLKTVAFLLLVAAIFVAALLLKAHWGIRQVNPALPTLETIEELLSISEPSGAGSTAVGPRNISYVLNASQPHPDSDAMTHSSFLFEWQDGRKFLIDLGMDEAGAVEFGELSETMFGSEKIEFHGTVADLLGPQAPQVTGVAFTHLHQDHTGGAAALCAKSNTVVRVFQSPWQSNWSNHITEMGRKLLDGASCLEFEELETESGNTLPGCPGLVAISAGGHTPGSTVYVARVNGKTWVFSGDITNIKDDILTNTPKAIWYSTLMVPEAPARLEVLRQWLAKLDEKTDYHVVVSHDLEALLRSGLPRFEKASREQAPN